MILNSVLHVSFEKPIRYSKVLCGGDYNSMELKESKVENYITLRIQMSMIIYSGCGQRKTDLSFGNRLSV